MVFGRAEKEHVYRMEMNEAKAAEKTDITLDYYNNNAEAFCSGTQNVAFSEHQNMFLGCLPSGAGILDLGCGSGRDSKAFLDQGYEVEAMDGSEELCRLVAKVIGKEVICRRFQELAALHYLYDGIWACASILHLSMTELEDVMRRICRALKSGGILYTSIKYKTHEEIRNGRYFNDMTEEKMELLLQRLGTFKIENMWRTSDVRPGRSEEKWLNLLLRANEE